MLLTAGPAKGLKTYWLLGETCDMDPTRHVTSLTSLFQCTIPLLWITMCFCTGTTSYRPLSFAGPSISMPNVLPSAENEWQLAQVGMSFNTVWLSGFRMSRMRQ